MKIWSTLSLDRSLACLCALLCVPLPAHPQQRAKPSVTVARPVLQGRPAPDTTGPQALAAASCPAVSGPNYSGQNLTDHNFRNAPPGSLRYANFSGATLNGSIFAGQDLTGANFQNSKLGPSSKGPVDFSETTLVNTCLIGAIMSATDFTYSTIQCADFSGTSLLLAKFGPVQNIQHGNGCRTKFIGSQIDVHAIGTSHWGEADFTGAQFSNLSPSTFTLASLDITGAMLGGTDWSDIDMQGANLTDVDFSRANLLKANMNSAALAGAKFAGANLSSATATCSRMHGSGTYHYPGCPTPPRCPAAPVSSKPDDVADFTQATMSSVDFSFAIMDSAVLSGANLSGANLRCTSLQSAFFEGKNTIPAASVLGSDLTAVALQNAHINNVAFNNVILTSAHVGGGTTLDATDFSGSVMPGADFTGAKLQNVSFHNTLLQGAVFDNTTLSNSPTSGGNGVNFSCAQLGGSSFHNSNVTVANYQAGVMPPAGACCTDKSGGSYCGITPLTGVAYGAVTYPPLTVPVYCPNGDVAQCSPSQWVIPHWQTNLCSVDHSTQTVWTKPDCGSTPGDYVKFDDLNLADCILASLPGHPDNITVSTAAQLSNINCPARGIKTLGGLDKFTGLHTLDLSDNGITQFTISFPSVTKLLLSGNQLTLLDVTQIPNLQWLEAADNKLTGVTGIGLLSPQILDIAFNQLTSFDLPILTTLLYADLSHNQLTGVLDQYHTTIAPLTSLSFLDLSGNSVPTLGEIKTIAGQNGALANLYLSCNPTFECHTLDSLNQPSASPALQKSSCAQFNPQSGSWIVLPHPNCSVAPSHPTHPSMRLP